jgi:uncharacterized cupin superfamily protein
MSTDPAGEAGAPAPVNVFHAGSGGGRVDVGTAAGSAATAMYLYDLAPGQSSCPYHYEYEEEWLLVVEGSVVIRVPGGERTLARGDVVCFPAGPHGAHKISNRSGASARTLVFSRARVPAVSGYPDSDKVGLWTGDGVNDDLFFRRETSVAWSHGEEGWNRADG